HRSRHHHLHPASFPLSVTPSGKRLLLGAEKRLLRVAEARTRYFRRRDMRRSASGLPPVWQVGQYWSEESANDTSRTVSPQTGHGSPVRPWTRRPAFFSAFRSPAASPADLATASRRDSCIAVYSVVISSLVK